MLTKYLKYIANTCGIGIVLLILLLYTRAQPIAESIPKAPLATEKRTTSRLVRSRYPTEPERLRAFQKSDFYRTIINNNLFRPLGWTPPRQKEPYRLLGTLIRRDGQTGTQAILQSTTARTTHIVSIGDTLDADTIVTDIQPKHVTLEKAGQRRTLTLNLTPWIK